MNLNTQPLPKKLTRPILLYRRGFLGDEVRVLVPNEQALFMFLDYDITNDFSVSVFTSESNLKTKSENVLHWEYL